LLLILDPLTLERIEVLLGPGSVLYGTGAVGGVVQLSTHIPTFEKRSDWGGSLLARGASADAAPGGGLWLAAKAEALTLVSGGALSHFGRVRDGFGVQQPMSDYRTGGWRARFVLAPPRKAFTLSGATLGGVVAGAGRADRLDRGDLSIENDFVTLSYLRLALVPKGALEDLALTGSYGRTEQRSNHYQCETDDSGAVQSAPGCAALAAEELRSRRRGEDRVDTVGASVRTRLRLWDRRLMIQSGFEVIQDFVDSSLEASSPDSGLALVTQPRGVLSDGSRYRTFGLFVALDVAVVRFPEDKGELHIGAGGRLWNVVMQAPDVPGIGDLTKSFTGFLGAAALHYSWAKKLTIYGRFDQGLRAPSLHEATGQGDRGSVFAVPGGALRPERSDTVEVGAKTSLGPVRANGAWFFSSVKDALVEQDATWQGQSVVEGKPVRQAINASRAEYQGGMGEISARLWRLTPRVGLSLSEGHVRVAGDWREVSLVPRLSAQAGLRYDHPAQRFFVDAFALYGDQINHWFTLNLTGGVKLTDAFRLDLALLNILDRHYKTVDAGFHEPGIDARATFTAQF
jgi:hemoglobin/transferrin/lactoferrin receptor protein